MTMSLDKSLESLSIKEVPAAAPPPLPTAAPPPPTLPLPPPSSTNNNNNKLEKSEESTDISLIQQQLISCSTLNNTDLLSNILSEITDHEKLASIINSTKDFSGNTPLHLCCKYGSFEVLDTLLDQEGVEMDPLNRDGETPLFSLVQYSKDEPEHGEFIIETLIDAGCDVNISNKDGLKAVDLVSKDNDELISILKSAEFVLDDEEYDPSQFQDDIDPNLLDELAQEGEEGESGSGSESD